MLPCLECTRGRCSSLPDKHSNAAAAAAVEREQLEQTHTDCFLWKLTSANLIVASKMFDLTSSFSSNVLEKCFYFLSTRTNSKKWEIIELEILPLIRFFSYFNSHYFFSLQGPVVDGGCGLCLLPFVADTRNKSNFVIRSLSALHCNLLTHKQDGPTPMASTVSIAGKIDSLQNDDWSRGWCRLIECIG